jgi:hypothetical protein
MPERELCKYSFGEHPTDKYISGSRVIIEGHLCIEGTARLMMLDV